MTKRDGKIPSGSRFDLSTGQWYSDNTIEQVGWAFHPPYGSLDTDTFRMPGGGHLENVKIIGFDGQEAKLAGKSLGSGERGLILPPRLVIDPKKRVAELTSLTIDPLELRLATLFWDRIDVPYSRAIDFVDMKPLRELIDAGLVVRSSVPTEGLVNDIVRHTYFDAFKAREAAEPGQWAVSQGDRSLQIIGDQEEEGRGLQVELHRAIPVPSGSVPIDDLLLFKEKRRDELRDLRDELNKFAYRVATHPDPTWAKAEEFASLEHAISEYIKIARDAGWKGYLATLIGNIGVEDIVLPMIAVGTGLIYGHPITVALGEGAARITVKAGAALKDFKAAKGPYRYISMVHRELQFI